MNWKEFTKGADFDLIWGMKGIKKSLIILLTAKVFLITYFLMNIGDWKDIFKAIIQMPRNFIDYMALFAGIIIFLAIPFLTGIRIGLNKKRKKEKKEI